MNTTVVTATTAEKLKTAIDALGVTVTQVVKVKNGEYLVIHN